MRTKIDLTTCKAIRKSLRSLRDGDKPEQRRLDREICEYLGKPPKPVEYYTSSLDVIESITPYGFYPCLFKVAVMKGGEVGWYIEYFDYREDKPFFQTEGHLFFTEAHARIDAVLQCIENVRLENRVLRRP